MAEQTGPAQKDHAAVKVIPPIVPVVIVLAGVGLNRLFPIEPDLAIPSVVRYLLGGLIIAGAILGLGVWSIIIMRRTGQTEHPWKPTTEIVERGPFRVTRNPMYLQMVIACFGFAVLLWNAWILVLTPACAWILQKYAILPEEAYLEQKFGESYLAYKGRVRRWI